MFEEHTKRPEIQELIEDWISRKHRNPWDKFAAENKGKSQKLHTTITPRHKTHCFICGEKEKPINRHHLKPKAHGLPKGKELIRTCLRCHTFIHKRWTNAELRNMTAEELRAKLLEELMLNQK